MDLLNKDIILNEIPLFAGLSERQRQLIKKYSSLREYKKGELIYAQDSPADAFYCVVLGRVVIYGRGIGSDKKVLEYLHRGRYFGIISLLTNEGHSVTAQALNDCLVLVIRKNDFDFILKRLPSLAIDLSRTLSRRLKRKDIHEKTIFESTVVSVFSSYSQAGKTVYALNLALSLVKETRKSVVVLDILTQDKIHSLPQRLEIQDKKVLDLDQINSPIQAKEFISKSKLGFDLICFYYNPEDDSSVKNLLAILSLLVNDYHYLILDLPSAMDKVIYSILNQSDLIHLLSSPEQIDLKKTGGLITRLREEFNFSQDKIKVILNEYKPTEISSQEQEHLLGSAIFATLPKIDFANKDKLVLDEPGCEYALAVRRISRQVSESLVGLALGVGVAYGFCHIGVLKVIEEEKIPIDVICGSSIGAVIAGLWAMGRTSGEIFEITKEFKEPKFVWGLVDFTFPFLGFLKGNKLKTFLKKHFDNKTFNDLKMPLKVVASSVKRKEPIVFDRGALADAIMASCSMPGVFNPFQFKEEMLFDGGVTHPLPTEPLMKMGLKKIIAVNVTPSREDILRQYEKIKETLTEKIPQDIRWKRWEMLRSRLKKTFKTNILDIIFSSIEILQSEVAQKEALLADVVLHPDTSGLYWMELHKAPEFVRRGEIEARRNLDRIWQVVNG